MWFLEFNECPCLSTKLLIFGMSPSNNTLPRASQADRSNLQTEKIASRNHLFTSKRNSIIKQLNPSAYKEVIAEWQPANEQDIKKAIEVALNARESWQERTLEDRAAIFLRAAELVSTKYRYEIIAATMLGQGKNIWQGEIDAGAEICGLLRWYVQCAFELHAQQPHESHPGNWNRQEYRPLEGFVYSISPFNFTALGANLAFGPALMGNTVIWKPSNSALHASWLLYKVMIEAGMPPDVVQWVPGDPEMGLLAKVGENTGKNLYRQYPRMVAETGGKYFHLVHKSASIDNAVNQTIRGAFEYQGQKCSATSRVYAPELVWPEFKEKIVERTKNPKVGNPEQYDNFFNSVIHEASFDKLDNVIQSAKSDPKVELLVGGESSKKEGFLIHPTLSAKRRKTHESYNWL
ncbi:hypothetical protein N7478_004421 [Penicillium angulare]|uniref:uncharacterized protein n=1 Tax=Penicillium angulare TaxID=116970 RepID=UPI002541C37B|nr:uncharacterized protein N7478_004421 [Penicillium angulare]KAJ5279049.1 hypothetical protein N7478_004421 [Penicillium angulare]